MATVTHKVVKGDTLSELAVKYGTTVSAIAALNNIKNVNLIYVGQTLYISGKPSSTSSGGSSSGSSGSSTNNTNSNVITITAFGLQAKPNGPSNVLFATWTWNKENTDKYEIQWEYYTANNQWFVGTHTTMDHETSAQHGYVFDSTYTVPDNALSVRFRVRPISKTYDQKSGDTTKQVSYWTAAWTGYKTINTETFNPPTIQAPTVTIENYTLTCKVDSIMDVAWANGETYVEFDIIKDDVERVYIGLSKIIYFSASYSCTIDAGHEYKVRARIKQGETYGEWTSYSSPAHTVPSAPSGITSCKATSSTSVQLKWNVVSSAETYTIEYATKKEYFEGSNATTKIDSIETTQYEITGLESGERYFFRVRAKNDKGDSGWTELASVIIGSKPGAPTTWSSTTTAIAGEELILYWIHNSEDESKEVRAELEIYQNDIKYTQTIENESTEDEITTSQYKVNIDANNVPEGATIKWRVRTAGITQEYGDWSVQRTVDVYAPPTLHLQVTDSSNNPLYVLESFPFRIKGEAGPATQKPVSFHVSIVAGSSYETVDEVGNFKMVIAGDEVFSRFYDIDTNLDVEILPNDVDLQSGVRYEIRCLVAMNSGLTKEVTHSFDVSWIEGFVVPNAEITYDKEKYVTHIRPYCTHYPDLFYKVDYVNQAYVRTDEVIDAIEGISVDNVFTPEGDIVYAGYLNNVMTHFCIVPSEEPLPVPGVKLSVYRREFDGKFTEIGAGLVNEENTFVTDPHPALDYARYRIVAISDDTGSVSYVDLPGFAINEKAIILQWNETWSNFSADNEGAILDPVWAGSLLRLPYNIDISESNTVDASMVKYIGREHPVSYYGTQVGSTATWSVDIPRRDVETIYSLRRLSTWMGDVYVREPSGSGYWANVAVSFSQTHKEVIIPVTLNITRVVGGV